MEFGLGELHVGLESCVLLNVVGAVEYGLSEVNVKAEAEIRQQRSRGIISWSMTNAYTDLF